MFGNNMETLLVQTKKRKKEKIKHKIDKFSSAYIYEIMKICFSTNTLLFCTFWPICVLKYIHIYSINSHLYMLNALAAEILIWRIYEPI